MTLKATNCTNLVVSSSSKLGESRGVGGNGVSFAATCHQWPVKVTEITFLPFLLTEITFLPFLLTEITFLLTNISVLLIIKVTCLCEQIYACINNGWKCSSQAVLSLSMLTLHKYEMRRANTQTIHMCHIYLTSLQSPPLHTKPLKKFELLLVLRAAHDVWLACLLS